MSLTKSGGSLKAITPLPGADSPELFLVGHSLPFVDASLCNISHLYSQEPEILLRSCLRSRTSSLSETGTFVRTTWIRFWSLLKIACWYMVSSKRQGAKGHFYTQVLKLRKENALADQVALNSRCGSLAEMRRRKISGHGKSHAYNICLVSKHINYILLNKTLSF